MASHVLGNICKCDGSVGDVLLWGVTETVRQESDCMAVRQFILHLRVAAGHGQHFEDNPPGFKVSDHVTSQCGAGGKAQHGDVSPHTPPHYPHTHTSQTLVLPPLITHTIHSSHSLLPYTHPSSSYPPHHSHTCTETSLLLPSSTLTPTPLPHPSPNCIPDEAAGTAALTRLTIEAGCPELSSEDSSNHSTHPWHFQATVGTRPILRCGQPLVINDINEIQ